MYYFTAVPNSRHQFVAYITENVLQTKGLLILVWIMPIIVWIIYPNILYLNEKRDNMNRIDFTEEQAMVTGYLHEDHHRLVEHKIRPAMVICPGGGYEFICPRESDHPALQFFADGFQVFILHYSVGEKAAGLRPLQELALTVKTIRDHCEDWHIDPEKIVVMGFSAGAHLAACLGTLHDKNTYVRYEHSAPNALILAYPVITMGEYTHVSTSLIVTGGDAALKEVLSVEKQVSPHMPPTFVWHTVDDGSVPVENSILLISSLQTNNIPFECHFFQNGKHGLSTCTLEVETPDPVCHEWLRLAKNWLYRLFDYRC